MAFRPASRLGVALFDETQVLGNAYIMDSERLTVPESQLKRGEISVREFVRQVAKSDLYRERFFTSCARFFESSAPYRFVELNFKHLLGRAPQDQAEISEHICCCVEQGYEADIDSYIDSAEYQAAFGDMYLIAEAPAVGLVKSK